MPHASAASFVFMPGLKVLALDRSGIKTKGGRASSAFSLLVDIKRKVAQRAANLLIRTKDIIQYYLITTGGAE